jgi:hypothetical protein
MTIHALTAEAPGFCGGIAYAPAFQSSSSEAKPAFQKLLFGKRRIPI